MFQFNGNRWTRHASCGRSVCCDEARVERERTGSATIRTDNPPSRFAAAWVAVIPCRFDQSSAITSGEPRG